MVTLYLASPYGFSEATRPFLIELRRRLRDAGHAVNDPWEIDEKLIVKQGLSEKRLRAEMNSRIAKANQVAIDASEAVVASLDGTDVDSGVASEIGYAFAQGKRIVGYRGDSRLTGDNEAAVVNLQVQYWIESSGGRIVRSISDLLRKLEEWDAGQFARRTRAPIARARRGERT